MPDQRLYSVSRKILIAVGAIFILNGLVVGGLNAALRLPGLRRSGSMPSLSVAIGFEMLGFLGLVAAFWGLRSPRKWGWFACAVAYLPWTVRGFLSDARQGLWPLVLGELLGLMFTSLALVLTAPRVFKKAPSNSSQL